MVLNIHLLRILGDVMCVFPVFIKREEKTDLLLAFFVCVTGNL